MNELAAFDTLDELENGWRYWQNRRFFRSGTDGVLLAEFCRCTPALRVMDLCSGTGIVPFLLLARGQAEQISALELQPYLCALMARSRALNGCEARMKIIEGDLCAIKTLAKGNCYDLVTVNPPYEPQNRGVRGANPQRELARREVACNLKQVVAAAAYLLKPQGRLAIVYRPYRLGALLRTVEDGGFAPSRLRLVQPKAGEPPALVLLEAVRCGKRELAVEPVHILGECE